MPCVQREAGGSTHLSVGIVINAARVARASRVATGIAECVVILLLSDSPTRRHIDGVPTQVDGSGTATVLSCAAAVQTLVYCCLPGSTGRPCVPSVLVRHGL
jgi:hypothetical protein